MFTLDTIPDQNELRTEIILPRLYFYEEGLRRGYEVTLFRSAGQCIPMLIKDPRTGSGMRISMGPYSYDFVNRPPKFTTSKEENIKMMRDVAMPIPTQWGAYFTVEEFDQDKRPLTFPVIIKPNKGSFSRGVHLYITTQKQAREIIIELLKEYSTGVVIEQQLNGYEYRLVFVEDEFVGCVQRRNANVTGDGIHSVTQLIAQRNTEPERGPISSNRYTNHPIIVDEHVRNYLGEIDIALDFVPPAGDAITLTRRITAASGVDYVDCTNLVHPDYIEACQRFMRTYNAFLIGFDLITSDITKSPRKVSAGFNEYNSFPWFDLNQNCNIGEKRDIAAKIWDHLERREDAWTTEYELK